MDAADYEDIRNDILRRKYPNAYRRIQLYDSYQNPFKDYLPRPKELPTLNDPHANEDLFPAQEEYPPIPGQSFGLGDNIPSHEADYLPCELVCDRQQHQENLFNLEYTIADEARVLTREEYHVNIGVLPSPGSLMKKLWIRQEWCEQNCNLPTYGDNAIDQNDDVLGEVVNLPVTEANSNKRADDPLDLLGSIDSPIDIDDIVATQGRFLESGYKTPVPDEQFCLRNHLGAVHNALDLLLDHQTIRNHVYGADVDQSRIAHTPPRTRAKFDQDKVNGIKLLRRYENQFNVCAFDPYDRGLIPPPISFTRGETRNLLAGVDLEHIQGWSGMRTSSSEMTEEHLAGSPVSHKGCFIFSDLESVNEQGSNVGPPSSPSQSTASDDTESVSQTSRKRRRSSASGSEASGRDHKRMTPDPEDVQEEDQDVVGEQVLTTREQLADKVAAAVVDAFHGENISVKAIRLYYDGERDHAWLFTSD